jgi:DNA end-binding protein Ku
VAMRPFWKAVLAFGDAEVPVKFYSAVEDRNVRFNLLHGKDLVRVEQRMVDPSTGAPVPSDQLRKGFEVEKDTYVMFDDAELEKLQPEPSRRVEIEQFVPRTGIDHQWFERAYLLGPDQASPDYAALVAALTSNKLQGLARWVMRGRTYNGALQVYGGYLALMSLRFADEVIPAASLPRPEGRALDAKELDLAGQLVGALHTDFDPGQYRDEYRERVREFLEAKARGHKPKLRIVPAPAAPTSEDLTGVLAASVKSARKEKRSA